MSEAKAGTVDPGKSPDCAALHPGYASELEHRIVVPRIFRDRLHDVPVFDHLAVLQLEDVDDRVASAAGLANRVNVQDDVVAIHEPALVLAVRVREFFAQKADELSESVRTIGRAWIVLDVAVADMGEGCI